jgi:hypothetical protein
VGVWLAELAEVESFAWWHSFGEGAIRILVAGWAIGRQTVMPLSPFMACDPSYFGGHMVFSMDWPSRQCPSPIIALQFY